MEDKIKIAKDKIELITGCRPSTLVIKREINNNFNGDIDAYLAYLTCFENDREEPDFMDDSWGDYETGDFC